MCEWVSIVCADLNITRFSYRVPRSRVAEVSLLHSVRGPRVKLDGMGGRVIDESVLEVEGVDLTSHEGFGEHE